MGAELGKGCVVDELVTGVLGHRTPEIIRDDLDGKPTEELMRIHDGKEEVIDTLGLIDPREGVARVGQGGDKDLGVESDLAGGSVPDADFGGFRTAISVQSGHPFRSFRTRRPGGPLR